MRRASVKLKCSVAETLHAVSSWAAFGAMPAVRRFAINCSVEH
jgi:hypothetical protein